MKQVCLYLILAISCVFLLADAATIKNIVPRMGSVKGQTRLSILGTGFDERGRSNDIYIGDNIYGVFCDPIPNECHSERIVCLTDAYEPVGPMPLSVRSMGFLADCLDSRGCTFEYSYEKTPQVNRIHPEWFTAPTILSVTGSRFSQGDPSVANFDFTMHLGAEERCDLVGKVKSTSFECQVESMFPGSLPVDIIHGAYGRAIMNSNQVVQLFPSINKIEPSTGSVAGGQLVTLYGTSFSSILSDNVIQIHGSNCPIVDYQNDRVICKTTPHDETSQPSRVWEDGKVHVQYWFDLYGTDISVDWMGRAEYLFPEGEMFVNAFGKETADASITTCNQCAFQFTTYFVPPTTGNYSFLLKGDDSVELWLSDDEAPVERKQENADAAVLDVTIFHSKRIAVAKYGTVSYSKSISLNAGNKYWMRGYLKENDGGESFDVKVKLPGKNTFEVIPSTMLHYSKDWKSPVNASVRGMPAMYAESCLQWGNCDYNYKWASTPVMGTVTASVAPLGSITIGGTGFSAESSAPTGIASDCSPTQCGGGGCHCSDVNSCGMHTDLCQWNTGTAVCERKSPMTCNLWSLNSVLVDSIPCRITAETSTTITCQVGFTTGGFHEVEVYVEGKGFASGQIFTTVTSSVRAIFPTNGSINGGNTLIIEGAAFDPLENITNVSIGAAACPVTSITSYEILCTVPSGSAGTVAVSVGARKHVIDVLRLGYSYIENFQRPGTDVVDSTVKMFPTAGSVSGRTDIEITLPTSSVLSSKNQVHVTVGAQPCRVSFALGRVVKCETSPSLAGQFSSSITITNFDGSQTTHTLPKFRFRPTVTSVSQQLVTDFGGTRVRLILDSQAPAMSELSVAVYGQKCLSLTQLTPQVLICFTAPKPATLPPLPRVATYNFDGDGNTFTNKLYRLDHTPDVRALDDGSVLIPKGANYLMSKERFTRPYQFRARVKPLQNTAECGTNCLVRMRAGVLENSFAKSGMTAQVGKTSAGRMYFTSGERGWWNSEAEFTGSLAGAGLDSSKFTEYRMEVWNSYIRFYVNDVIVFEVEDSQFAVGAVGFGHSSQDIIVDDFVVESLYPRALQVNVSAVAYHAVGDILYTGTRHGFQMKTFQPTTISGDTRIALTGESATNLRDNSEYYYAYALKTATEAVTANTPILCGGTHFKLATNVITSQLEVQCADPAELPAGQYYVRVAGSYGLADSVTAITYGVKVKSIEPRTCKSGGTMLTISGHGFSSANSPKVGSAVCEVVSRSINKIVCFAPPSSGNQIVYVGSKSCGSACSLNYDGVAPTITSITPTSGGHGTKVTITGMNFNTTETAFVKIGMSGCSVSSRTVTEFVCTIHNVQQSGAQNVRLFFSSGLATGVLSFTFATAVLWIEHADGSTSGGQLLRLRGSQIPTMTGATVFHSWAATSAVETSLWTNSNPHKGFFKNSCGDNQVLGFFDRDETVTRSFGGLPAHGAIRIGFKIYMNSARVHISIGDHSYEVWNEICAPVGECFDDVSCVQEGSFVVPHTASSGAIQFWSASGKWGLASYSIHHLAAIPHSVTVGGANCPVEKVTDFYIDCRVPAGAAGSSNVRATINQAEHCSSCTYKYNAERVPIVSAIVVGTADGVTSAIPEFELQNHINVSYTADGAVLQKSGMERVWDSSALAPQGIRSTEATNVGVQWTASDPCRAMVGLTSVNKTSSYWDIDFALYQRHSSDLLIYENGAKIIGVGYFKKGDVFSVYYDTTCSCVRYTQNNRIIYSSRKSVHKWPMMIDTSFYDPSCKVTNIKYLHTRSAATRLVLAGTGLEKSSKTYLQINGQDCTDVYSANGHVNCWTQQAITPGTTSIAISNLRNYHGYGTDATLTVTFAATNPATLKASLLGGKTLTIHGGPFATTPVVTVGTIGTCSILKATSRTVWCTTPVASTDQTGVLKVMVGAVEATCLSTVEVGSTGTSTGCATISFESTSTPNVASVLPVSAISGTMVTLTGTKFPFDGISAEIKFGDDTCSVQSASDTKIVCKAGAHVGGTYTPLIRFPSIGNSNTFAIATPLAVSATSTSLGGNLGGAIITFSGSGFGTSNSTTAFNIQSGGVDLCSSIERLDTTCKCVVKAGDFSGTLVLSSATTTYTTTQTFTSAAANVPTITAITPTQGGRGLRVTIQGTNLDAGATVTVGSGRCVVVGTTSTNVICEIVDGLPAGSQAVSVTTFNRGLASGSVAFTTLMYVQSITPTRGPKAGGQTVTISGAAFPAMATLSVTVGGSPCTVSTSSVADIVCVTGKMDDAMNRDVVVAHMDSSQITTFSAGNYVYDSGLTANITGVSPTSGSAAGLELLTISGTSFNTDASRNTVLIGSSNTPCDVETVSDAGDSIVCRTRPHIASGALEVNLLVENQGFATRSSGATFQYLLQIDSISSAANISVEGGVNVTFVGSGFYAMSNNKHWMYHKTKLSVGGRPCKIWGSTTTSITCEVAGSQRPYIDMPTLRNDYPMRPAASDGIALTINGIDATVASSVAVGYDQSVTPIITSVTPAPTDVTVEGTVVTIIGSLFAASGNKVLIGGSEQCTISTESATQIVCTVMGTKFGKLLVQVWVPGKGVSHTTRACPTGQFLLCDGSCITEPECRYDEWGMETCAELMNLVVHDTFCHSNGGTDRVNKPFRTDSEKEFMINCPMYSCEGKDCNQSLFIGGRGGRISTCGQDPNGFVLDVKPQIDGFTPTAGSLGGGQRVTITGKGFRSDVSAISVFLYNSKNAASCTPITVTPTSVVCETSKVSSGDNEYKLRLWVWNVEAHCTPICNGTIFTYTNTLTPTLTYVTPPTAILGSPITILGTLFSTTLTDNKVSVGGKACTVTAATATQIVCTAPYVGTSGTKTVHLRIASKGSPTADKSIKYGLAVQSVDPRAGSTRGGTRVTVTGTGFTNFSEVWFGSCSTKKISHAYGVIVVETAPCAGTQNVKVKEGGLESATCTTCSFNFASGNTPAITSFTLAGLNVVMVATNIGSDQSKITVKAGDALCSISSFSSGNIACSLPSSHPGGTYEVLLHVDPLGYATAAAPVGTVTYATTISSFTPSAGSWGGNQNVTITGTGFGTIASMSKVTIAGIDCQVRTSIDTQIVCTTGQTNTAADVSGAPTVNISHAALYTLLTPVAAASSYSYQAAKTPTVTSVAPTRGSTAGGTRLTIGGTGLTNSQNVTIDGIECTQSTAEQAMTAAKGGTMLFCTTSLHKTVFAPSKVQVTTAGDGDAYNEKTTYQYIDLWSRWTTWGNTPPPVRGDSAVISEGQVVVIDQARPPRFHLIIVMGHLMFDNSTDIFLECTYIMINFGRFTIGEHEKPFTKKATIQLWGDRLTPEIPVHGSKVIALRHGALDMHGIPRQPTWTHIAGTVLAGKSTITVKGPIDWKINEFIGIATTDYDPFHSERRMIVGLSPADGQAAVVTIELEHPLEFKHYGERQCFDSGKYCIDEIAEVALLTRNIVIQGDRWTKNIGFGATLFLMPLGERKDRYARLSFVEFRDVGQQFIVGRYPVHYHVTHEANNSYCNGTSVHFSLNRAFSIHGINNNTYVDNVVFDTHGHSFFIEDGSEKWNVIKHNVVMRTRVSTSNLNTDLTPANFWIVSPSNYIVGNAAAGSQNYGYWIAPFHPHSTGPTYSPTICPSTHKLWKFEDNVAHSNGKYGVNIFQFWWPKERECSRGSPDAQAFLRNIVVYKNQIHGVTLGNHEVGEVGAVVFDNLTSADNGLSHKDSAAYWIERVSARNMSCGLQNSVLIALTNNDPFRRSKARRGINLPLGDNFYSDNVAFVNYNNENYGYEPQAWAERMSLCFPWGWDALSRGLKWVNSPNRVRFRFQHHGNLNDEDGTLSGLANSQLVPRAPLFDSTVCHSATGFETFKPALVCPSSYKIRRIGISSVSEFWTDQKWTIDGRTEIVPEILRNYLVTAPINKEIYIDFGHWSNPRTWWWNWGGTRYMRPNERALFATHYNETRHHVYAEFGAKGVNKTWQKAMPTLASPKSDYAFDNETMLFKGLLRYPDRKITVEAFNCPAGGCPVPPLPPAAWDKACSRFNDPKGWASGKVPADGADVHITYQDVLCLGGKQLVASRKQGSCSVGTKFTYNFATIKIEGGLRFMDDDCPCAGSVVTVNVDKWFWIRGSGGFVVGNGTHPITSCKFEVVMKPLNFDDPTALSGARLVPWGFRAFTLESGTLKLRGNKPQPLWTRLTAPGIAGSKTIVVEKAVNWKAGDAIVIAGTSKTTLFTTQLNDDSARTDQSEKHKIASVSADGKTITLATALVYHHIGDAPQSLNGKMYSIGAEVAVLSRSVTMHGGHDESTDPKYHAGWQFSIGCTDVHEECNEGWPMGPTKPGLVEVDGVAFKDIGVAGTKFGGIEIDGLTNGMDAAGSFIRNSAIDRAFNTGMVFEANTERLNVHNNVIYNYRGDGIRAMGNNNSYHGNLAIRSAIPVPNCNKAYSKFWDCRTAAFRVHSGNNVTENIAASGITAGFMIEGEPCDGTETWSDNVAHSMRDGVLLVDGPGSGPKWRWGGKGRPQGCRKVNGVMTYWSADHGFAAWYIRASQLYITNYTSVENLMGLMIMTMSSGLHPEVVPKAYYSNMVFAGHFKGSNCQRGNVFRCRSTLLDSRFWCKFFMTPAPKMANIGMMETVHVSSALGIGRTIGEDKFLWMEPDSYATMEGQTHVSNVHFANFDGVDNCGQKNVAFAQNPYSNDTFHQHTFEKISWSNITNGGHFWARRTYGEVPYHPTDAKTSTWYLDFDNYKYGGFWPDSPNKIWLTDKDGSFTGMGKTSSVLASETITRKSSFKNIRWDGRAFQAGRLAEAREGCTWKPEWNAFVCDDRFKWFTVAVESLAEDTLTRRAGPLVLCKGDGMIEVNGDPICQGGIVDFASGPVMKGKAQRQTLDRLSRWRMIAEQGGNYTLSFRGQPPTWLRITLQNHEYLNLGNGVGATLNLRYFGQNSKCRVGVYVNGKRQRPGFGFDYPWFMNPPQTWPAPTDPLGTHFHDKYVNAQVETSTGSWGYERNVLYFSLRPGVLELKQEPIIQINMDVSMPVEEFFNNKETFIAAMVAVLGIDPSRVKFAEIVPGTNRRRQTAGTTALSMELDQADSVGESEVSGASASNDFSLLMSKLEQLKANPSLLVGFSISGLIYSEIQVTIVRPEIVVSAGTPYISMNVTDSTASANFDREVMRDYIVEWFRANIAGSPYNETQSSEVYLTAVWTNRDTNWTQLAIVTSFENNNHTKPAMDALFAQFVKNSNDIYPTWKIRNLYYSLNGWVPEGEEPTTTAPSEEPEQSITGAFENKATRMFLVAAGVGLLILFLIACAASYYFCVVRPKKAREAAARRKAMNIAPTEGSMQNPTSVMFGSEQRGIDTHDPNNGVAPFGSTLRSGEMRNEAVPPGEDELSRTQVERQVIDYEIRGQDNQYYQGEDYVENTDGFDDNYYQTEGNGY